MKSSFFVKKIFDFTLASLSLPIVLPIIGICWLVATWDTKSNGFFFQRRVGQYGNIFYVIKIKTMRNLKPGEKRSAITSEVLSCITPCGSFFRKYKLDELPQIINILTGKMSFVGPRPDVEGYADALHGDDKLILQLKPGITGPASLKYKDEEMLLASKSNPKKFYDEVIWPDKVSINKNYYMNYSFFKDIYYIFKTVFSI
ncbi:MAG: sugar transferase [Desulfobacterales bacterium]|nr:MAG: sugar transferase [Desulfobacterales bacterium]